MEVPASCKPCFDRQKLNLERAGVNRPVDLCPLLALLAMKSEHSTPLIQRHFLNLAEGCVTETHGNGGLYKIQRVQGERAVAAAIAVNAVVAQKEAKVMPPIAVFETESTEVLAA